MFKLSPLYYYFLINIHLWHLLDLSHILSPQMRESVRCYIKFVFIHGIETFFYEEKMIAARGMSRRQRIECSKFLLHGVNII